MVHPRFRVFGLAEAEEEGSGCGLGAHGDACPALLRWTVINGNYLDGDLVSCNAR